MRPGVIVALLLLLLLAGCASRAPRVDLAVVDAHLVQPREGRVLAKQTVLIRGDRIVAVGDAGAVDVPDGTAVLDARGRYLIPGLWDMHVHALWDPAVETHFLPLFVASGVTGVRDMGGTLPVLQAVRRKLLDGPRPWPQLVAAGPVLDGPQPVDPSISLPVADAEQGRAAVQALAAAGVDFIKVYTLLPAPAFEAVVQAARARGLAVAGHIPHGVDARTAAQGMRSVEHLRAETGGLCAGLVDADCRAVYAALREQGVWMTPTLVARRPRAIIDDAALAADPRLALLPPVLRQLWLGNRERTLARLSPEGLAQRRQDFRREQRAAGELPRRGLPVLAGSDAGSDFVFPGDGLHEELALLVDAGLSSAEALQAATSNAADYLQRDDIGHVGVGAMADLVLLDGNPLQDIRHTSAITAVVLRGRLYDRAALDALRMAARQSAP